MTAQASDTIFLERWLSQIQEPYAIQINGAIDHNGGVHPRYKAQENDSSQIGNHWRFGN
jgi:hypothetical protein